MISHRSALVVTVASLVAAGSVQAQRQIETAPAKFSMAKEYRAVQQSALASQRKLMLSFADSMPERLYRDEVTPTQRDFAQQIQHIVGSSRVIAGAYLAGPPGTRPDTAKILNSRAGLKEYINAEFDALDKLMREQTDADRDLQVKFFNGQFMPRWQIWDELNQHVMWTAGQVVANFRKHGMAPPSFLFF